MNKFILSVIFPALVALASSAPSVGPVERRADELAAMRALPALEHEEVRDKYGQFVMRYVTAEGIIVLERGRLVPNLDGDDYVLVLEGEVSYVADDGKVYVTKYSAGIDGYHVEGAHLPTTPKPIVSGDQHENVASPEPTSSTQNQFENLTSPGPSSSTQNQPETLANPEPTSSTPDQLQNLGSPEPTSSTQELEPTNPETQ